ncbi:MAG: 50S ribosomal protein L35 [Candidatus Pacebacteria bacterium]|nr:50S ribosomal protein L35 [Candidatus Paceibacterota bacterium]
MKLKTNKSVAKRLKLTKNGKIQRRSTGHCSFQAKHNNAQSLSKKKKRSFDLKNKIKSAVLPKK